MILSKKNSKDTLIRPRKQMFGEEWFVSAENMLNDFWGVMLGDARAQPFPTREAADKFAGAMTKELQIESKVIDMNGNILLHLTP